MLLLEGYHHSSLKLEAEQATGWIEAGWRFGNFRNSDELCAAPRGEFCSTHGSIFFPFFIDIAGNSNIRDPWILQELLHCLYGQRFSKEHRQGAKRKSWQWQG